MLIYIKRKKFTTRASIGNGSIKDDIFRFFTIEDVARAAGVKIPKETAIPPGEYPVIMDYSPRHQSIQPHILNVPGFTGIRFDIANYAEQVEGCIAVGASADYANNAVYSSAVTHAILCDKIQAAIDRGEAVCVVVTNEPESPIKI